MITLVIILAFILRLISLNQSLWLDEGINVNVARILSFKDLVLNYSLSDFHPPLYHVLLKTWILLFGSSEISVRLPSVILGVGTVFTIYLIAKKLFEEKTALIASTLIATSPLHVYYSQEARMYMLAAFLASFSVYFFIAVLKKDAILNWLGFIVATTLMLYSDYLPYLLLPAFFLYIVMNMRRIPAPTVRAFLPAFVLIFSLIMPWLFYLPQQLSVGLSTAVATPAWAQVVGSANFRSLALTFVKFTIGRISYQDDLIYALIFAPVGLFVVLLFLVSLFRISNLRSILWYWLLVPITLGIITSFFIPVFAYFRLIFVLGAFYIIWASAINTVNWTFLTRILLALALAINLISTTIYLVSPNFQREDWRGAFNYISKNFSPDSIVLFESDYTIGPFDYYNQGRINAEGALESFNPEYRDVERKVSKLTKDKNRVFLFQYLSGITDPQGFVFAELTKEGFANTSTKDFEGVGFLYEFNR